MKVSGLKLLSCLICAIVLEAPSVLVAQYAGGHGHRNGGGGHSGSTSESKNNDLKGFERAVALQATPEQIAQFQRLSASTNDARKHSQELLQLLSSGKTVGNADPLANAVEEAQSENEKFVRSFSKEQEEGLKKFIKKMRKADSAITSQSKALNLAFQHGPPGGQFPAAVEKLDKALSDFRSEQFAVAAEMGIQSD